MAQRLPAYRVYQRPLPARPRRRRFRRLRRLAAAIILLAVVGFVAWGYFMTAYAPSLRAEARTIPDRVRGQLVVHASPYVPLSAIAPDLPHAIVAIEDRRFYLHPGVDPLGLVRALWVDLQNDHVDQGGSTLEEQLVKRAIVQDETSLHDKLRTMALAWAVDQEFDKQQFLELYLNDAYFGQGAYGAEAAARTYFGVDAGRLTLPESAFLAALPQAPSIYGAAPRSPAVVARYHRVLQDMAALGYITPSQEQAAEQTPLRFALPNL